MNRPGNVRSKGRARPLLLRTSLTALALGCSQHAYADCAPDPTVANTTTTCSGTDSDGLVVSTHHTTVDVLQGALVQPGSNPASIMLTGESTPYDSVSLNVSGTVDGGSVIGVLATSSADTPGAASLLVLDVADTGVVSGSTAVRLQPRADNLVLMYSVIKNAGRITSTTGPAIDGEPYTIIDSITNAASGTIGGIKGLVGKIDNAGRIDATGAGGWALSIDSMALDDIVIHNSGVIAANAGGSFNPAPGGPATTPAIAIETHPNDYRATQIVNDAGARIEATGALSTAIRTARPLTLTNAGTITGTNGFTVGSDDALARQFGTTQFSGAIQTFGANTDHVDNTGTITGSTDLGGGDDLFNNSGTVNGNVALGTGNNRLENSGSIKGTVTLIGFDTLENSGTIDGGSSTGLIVASSPPEGGPEPVYQATYVNVDIAQTGVLTGSTGLRVQLTPNNPLVANATITNAGTISGTSGLAIVAEGNTRITSITNAATGTIDGGVSGFVGAIDNAGRIETSQTAGTALNIDTSSVDAGISIHNSGVIAANAGGKFTPGQGTAPAVAIAATPSNFRSTTITNDAGGRIEATGALSTAIQTGRQLTVNNAGTISGSNDFTVAADDALAQTFGTTQFYGAIQTFGEYEDQIDNSGTINGSVGTAGGNDTFSNSGIVNGIIDLGAGSDKLDNTGTITGAIQAGAGDDVLQNSATINGAIDLGEGNGTFTNTGIVNGDISRAGTIDGQFSAAINRGAEIDNSGTINLIAGSGVYSARKLVNSGSILEAEGTTRSTGVFAVQETVNSGTIRVNGIGLQYVSSVFGIGSNPALVNSGTIESRADTAVHGTSYPNASGQVSEFDNTATGVIRGNGDAIAIDGATKLVNDGQIFGNVKLTGQGDLGSSEIDNTGTITGNVAFGAGNDLFVSHGGTVTGDLSLGAGNDVLIETAQGFGVTGTIDGGDGTDYIGHERSQSSTVTLGGPLPLNFEDEFVLSRGAGTVVTVNAPAAHDTNLYFGGDGQIVNRVATNGSVLDAGALAPGLSGTTLASFTNEANVARGVTLHANAFVNSATIGSDAQPGGIALILATPQSGAIAITNSGTIQSDAGGYVDTNFNLPNVFRGPFTHAAAAILSEGGFDHPTTITNSASGTIEATGPLSIAISVIGPMTLTNEGTITGGNGFVIAPGDFITNRGGAAVNYGAIQTQGDGNDRIVNSGTITGSIGLRGGDDVIMNSGAIHGDVALGAGDDQFYERAGGVFDGVLDGGDGTDLFSIDATGGGSVDGSHFVSIERFVQTGDGELTYSGAFTAPTIELQGTRMAVASGASVSTAGPVTVTGSDGAEQLRNAGMIAGSVALGGGNDLVENRGAIGGSVDLGAGDDIFVEGAGSSVAGSIEGGTGTDTYRVELAGDRSGMHARSGFEQLGVTGTGTLSLTLDQNWSGIALAGTGLDLKLAGFTPGAITGSDAAETLAVDGDVASVALGGGDDSLAIASATLAGSYSGGAGNDSLHVVATGPVTLSGTLTGFETIALDGGALQVTGTLGAAGETTGFGAGNQSLTLASGGTLAGAIDLGDGADTFRLKAGGTLAGTVSGGAGDDLAVLDLTQDMALAGDALQQFETIRTTGAGALTISGGAAHFGALELGGHALTVASGASLDATQVRFGDGADTFTVAGAFSGQVDLGGGDDVLRVEGTASLAGGIDGGAGNNRLEIAAGGSYEQPAMLGTTSFTNFGTLAMESGVATYGGDSSFGTIAITGGRLIGLAGSRLAASQITVAEGATFGSAGTVVGNVAVAGTLSPGASPGTMTVTGDVSLAGGSNSLFEITPAVSDQLLVSGKLTIASGSTLTLTGSRPITPGVALDLIVADGGIDGSFSTIDKAPAIVGYLSQTATRLQLLGTFLTDPSFSPQVNTTISYLNDVLIAGQASPSLIAAVPNLLTPAGTSDAAAFRTLSPEAYASASQLGTQQALALVEAARTQRMTAPTRSGLFAFGQGLGERYRISGDGNRGISGAHMRSYGGLGGIGLSGESGWVGGFVGYLDGRQTISGLGAKTDAQGIIAGVQGELRTGHLGLSGLLAYSGGHADTNRPVAGGSASGHFALHSWIADFHASYQTPVDRGMILKPSLGVTGVRTTRGALTETGGSPFGLSVARERETRWFVDGELMIRAGEEEGARFHPYAAVGYRRLVDGRHSAATAAIGSASLTYTVPGLDRGENAATTRLGFSYDASSNLSIFASYSGEFGQGTRHSVSAGLRLTM